MNPAPPVTRIVFLAVSAIILTVYSPSCFLHSNVSLNPKVKKAVEYFFFHCFGDERPIVFFGNQGASVYKKAVAERWVVNEALYLTRDALWTVYIRIKASWLVIWIFVRIKKEIWDTSHRCRDNWDTSRHCFQK